MHSVEAEYLGYEVLPKRSYYTPQVIVDEQIAWWRGQDISPWEAFEALYGFCPGVMGFGRLRDMMLRDFT